jgi:hypothetical protein
MTLVETFPREHHLRAPAQSGPFGLSWLSAVLLSEATFMLCRAGAQGSVSIDDVGCWVLGLSPFVLQHAFNRFFSMRSTRLVETWLVALTIHLAFQFLDIAHLIEYPINLSFDLGLGRSLVTAVAYGGLALSSLLCISMWHPDRVSRARSYFSGSVAVIPVLAFTLFQAY